METLNLAKHIAEYRHTPFMWGQSDCNVFVYDWIDKKCNSKLAETLIGHYSNTKEMLRFAKVKKIKKDLAKAGYEQVYDVPQTGDILLQKSKNGFYHSAIVMNDCVYTMNEELGLVKSNLNRFNEDEIWRIT